MNPSHYALIGLSLSQVEVEFICIGNSHDQMIFSLVEGEIRKTIKTKFEKADHKLQIEHNKKKKFTLIIEVKSLPNKLKDYHVHLNLMQTYHRLPNKPEIGVSVGGDFFRGNIENIQAFIETTLIDKFIRDWHDANQPPSLKLKPKTP